MTHVAGHHFPLIAHANVAAGTSRATDDVEGTAVSREAAPASDLVAVRQQARHAAVRAGSTGRRGDADRAAVTVAVAVDYAPLSRSAATKARRRAISAASSGKAGSME